MANRPMPSARVEASCAPCALALALMAAMLPAGGAFLLSGGTLSPLVALSQRLRRPVCGASRTRAQDGPRLTDVRLPPCKKLCPGCEPWLCPLAPQGEAALEANFASESSRRLAELREEQRLELERERLEALAAGVREVCSDEELNRGIHGADATTLVVVFWGGKWCRKCRALKPKYVSLSKKLQKMPTDHAIDFFFADVKRVSQGLLDSFEVSVVPAITVFRGGGALGRYVAGAELKDFLPGAEALILSHVQTKS